MLGRTSGETAAGPRAVRGRCHQSAADHPPRARAEAHRPAADRWCSTCSTSPSAPRRHGRRASGLSAELGVPVVTSIAVRKGGTAELLRLTDEIAGRRRGAAAGEQLAAADRRASCAPPSARPTASSPTASACRAGPTPGPARIDAVVLHPVGGLSILLALILFVMFQAVFAWAQPLMDLLSTRLRRARRSSCTTRCPPACCRASCRTA